jgi:hypothetical protein
MWVIFRKSDNEVIGLSADSEIDLDKDAALQEVVRGLAGSTDPNDYDAFQVKGRDKVAQVKAQLFQPHGRAKVQPAKGGTDLEVVQDSEFESGTILVTTDATQLHPVDNVPLIPGDGTSFLVVTLQKVDDQGKPLTRKTKDKDVIWLRINHGTLRPDVEEAELQPEIRSVTLVAGTAKFRIYSENAKRLATVQMLTANPELRFGGVQVEFT